MCFKRAHRAVADHHPDREDVVAAGVGLMSPALAWRAAQKHRSQKFRHRRRSAGAADRQFAVPLPFPSRLSLLGRSREPAHQVDVAGSAQPTSDQFQETPQPAVVLEVVNIDV